MNKRILFIATVSVSIGLMYLSAEPDMTPALRLEAEKRSFLVLEQEGASQRRLIQMIEEFQSTADDKKQKFIEDQKTKLALIKQRLEYKEKAISGAVDESGLGRQAVQEVEAMARDFLNRRGVNVKPGELIVETAFRIGRDVSAFANKDDVIWDVRLGPGKSGLLWINLRTKSIQALGISDK